MWQTKNFYPERAVVSIHCGEKLHKMSCEAEKDPLCVPEKTDEWNSDLHQGHIDAKETDPVN